MTVTRRFIAWVREHLTCVPEGNPNYRRAMVKSHIEAFQAAEVPIRSR
jgi:hypothetical protein